MSEVWPLDVKNKMSYAAQDSIRPFKCLLLMPFDPPFNWVAEIIRSAVFEVVGSFSRYDLMELPVIERLDWVTSSNVIHQEIWSKIHEADLIFCDITGHNPNVMGEIIITEPNEEPHNSFYEDKILRQGTQIDSAANQHFHHFHIVFNESILKVKVDDFSHTFQVAQMKKVFGAGLIRFRAYGSWMIIKHLKITET